MKTKRILFFTKYTRKGASSRLRTFQYLPAFKANGLECVVSPLFDDAYLGEVYQYKRHNKQKAFLGFMKRFFVLFTVWRYKVVVIEKELFPYFPAWPEQLLSWLGVKYVVDYDDAIWHNYDVTGNALIRFLFSHKIDRVMGCAAAVVAGNQYIYDRALSAGAKKVWIIPTVVDLGKYNVKENFSNKKLVVGWIGSPITSKYLWELMPVFRPFMEQGKMELKLIGAEAALANEPHVTVIPWHEQEEAEQIRTFDVGIMPLVDTIWERGKCGYKLIQYMACGVPVVGTPIGVNDSLIRTGWNGWKATTLADWKTAIDDCLAQQAHLQPMGKNGRALVEREYSLQRYQQEWINLLQTLIHS